MATRTTHDLTRTESPRLKDLPKSLDTARDPAEGRDQAGRFAPGDRSSVGHGFKALIRRGLGNPDDPAVAELVKAATQVYLHTLRSLPSDGAGVRPLVAAFARHVTLATHYANEAARVGLSTAEGLKLAEASRQHDTTAQRLSVTAFDRAVREAASRPAKPIDWAAAMRPRGAQ